MDTQVHVLVVCITSTIEGLAFFFFFSSTSSRNTFSIFVPILSHTLSVGITLGPDRKILQDINKVEVFESVSIWSIFENLLRRSEKQN